MLLCACICAGKQQKCQVLTNSNRCFSSITMELHLRMYNNSNNNKGDENMFIYTWIDLYMCMYICR